MSLSVFYCGTCIICAFLCRCCSFYPSLCCLSSFLLSYLFQGHVACWNFISKECRLCVLKFKIAFSWRVEILWKELHILLSDVGSCYVWGHFLYLFNCFS